MIIRNQHRLGRICAREIGLVLVALALLGVAVYVQHTRFERQGFRVWIYEQKLKLPPSEVLKVASLGYRNIYANFLWLQSIQAFGSGWRTEGGKTEPMFQYFDTLTDVDPTFEPAYRFGNLVVGDQRGDYKLGQEILRKGSMKMPGSYSIPYLGVYNATWMGDNPIDGKWFAIRLQRIKSAPNFMKRMLEYIERQEGRYEVAFEMNVRYYLDYYLADDEIESQIVTRRMQDLMDRQARSKLSEAIYKYIDKNGEHPKRTEDILTPEYLPPYLGPSPARFRAALDKFLPELQRRGLKKGDVVPDELVRAIAQSSQENIEGLPPDPFGTWYMIHTPTKLAVIEEGFVEDRKKPILYLVNAADLLQTTNRNAMQFQQFVLRYYSEHKEQPPDSEVTNFLGRDPFGGHYAYDRKDPAAQPWGSYRSTGARRIEEKTEPRLGLRGRGPFPFSIEPKLSDIPEEKEWGLKNGYILPDGTEVWETEEQKAARMKAKTAEDAEKADAAKVSGP
ncbi:hypothetical protein IT570_08350 [Candidatus Sumerlaeota bacterium]|nr:hypothetical protein [Candidatus Sumerlaeota bacterium]